MKQKKPKNEKLSKKKKGKKVSGIEEQFIYLFLGYLFIKRI